jgi:hypothetical protein
MFTVHTTAGIGVIEAETSHIAIQGQDCFYGWGERQDRIECLGHTIILVESLSDASALAKTLTALGEQVVVTDDKDWSQVVNSATVPVYYLAQHQH